MKTESWAVALKVMARLTCWIAFPVIIGSFLGEWLDKRFGTEPWLFLATIGVSFLVSMYGLIINAMKEFKKVEKDYKENQDYKENKEEKKNIIKK